MWLYVYFYVNLTGLPFSVCVIVLKIKSTTDVLAHSKTLFINNFNHDTSFLFFVVRHYRGKENVLLSAALKKPPNKCLCKEKKGLLQYIYSVY